MGIVVPSIGAGRSMLRPYEENARKLQKRIIG
jgi:hypothetical protein